jgi:HK97 family phage major capsid protein
MAVRNISAWIPIPLDNNIIQSYAQPSVVERIATPRPMTADAQEFPRLTGSDVGGGVSLTEDTHDGSKIAMYSYLYNGKHSFNEHELEDAVGNSLQAYSFEWLNQLNISFDNAALGVTGARSSTASDKRPYTSVYKAVRTSDSDVDYTADTNFVSGAASYANLGSLFNKVEITRYWADGSMVVLAHPTLRNSLRGLVDDNHRPIFLEANGTNVAQDTIFGKPIQWTVGAKSSTSFAMATAGNPLMVLVNRNYLLFGDRIAPQSRLIPAAMNPTELVHVMQHRARRGACLTIPQAAAVLEVTA